MHIAVITEYNPFHLGHEYQLRELRRAFPDATLTAVMGGIFSQRGEPYVTTPYVRAEAALLCGADLAVELPFPFSCAPAETFARAGVEIAAKIGADMLAFGSECGDINELYLTLERLDSPELRDAVKKEEENDKTLGKTRAFCVAYKKLYGKECSSSPNDILAYEYLRAIRDGGYRLKPYTIKRVGDFKSGEGGFASATSIRRDIEESGTTALSHKVPAAAEEIYKNAHTSGLFCADFEKLSSAVMLKLCAAQKDDLAYSSDGFYRRLKSAAESAKSIAELKDLAATKGYTNAEISRRIVYALLDVTRDDLSADVSYTRVFGSNERGRAVLGKVQDIEITTKPSAMNKLSHAALKQYKKTFVAERAFALCLDGDYNHLKQTPIII